MHHIRHPNKLLHLFIYETETVLILQQSIFDSILYHILVGADDVPTNPNINVKLADMFANADCIVN